MRFLGRKRGRSVCFGRGGRRLGRGRRRAQVLICVDVEGASVIEKRAAAEKLVAAKAAAASSASQGAGEDAGAQPVGSHVVTRGTSFANAPRFKSTPKPSGEADEAEGASADAADKSREGADVPAAKPADAADDKSADAAKSEMPAKPADDKPAEAAKPEAPAKPEAKRESSFANAPRFKPKPKPKPREEADASASSSDSFSSARNAFAKPSGASAPKSSSSSRATSSSAKPAESSKPAKSSKSAKPAASREPIGAAAASREPASANDVFANPSLSLSKDSYSSRFSSRPASSRSSSRSSSRISSADPAPARSSKVSSSRRSKYEPRVKQMVFSDKDQLEQYREMAERDNAWALKENENARYRTAKVYDYDPRPLTGLAPGTIISCERSDARVIVGPESTWHAEDWHGGVALAYRGKPFGVVNEKEIRGLREIPVRVGGLLPGYKGIPETSLYIREDDTEQFPLKDPEKYQALNNKPAGRELIADTTVDLVGEEEVQFLLEALGEGWVWLTAYLDYFETGKHEGEPCVCFKLDGFWCGHLTAMMSERYWQAVCNRESTVCLAKIVEGPNKYELKAKLPSKKAIQDFYGR